MTKEAREAEHRMAAINAADEWLAEHRVNESWRMINRLRDELVRSSDTYNAGFREGIRFAAAAIDELEARD